MSSTISINDISLSAFADEGEIIKDYLSKAQFFKKHDKEIFDIAAGFVSRIREDNNNEMNIENFLKEYSLSTYEGVAILCLAEALLRIPDKKTADELIKDKLIKGDWQKHMNNDSGFMLNVSSFAFLLSGEVLSLSKVENKLLRSVTNIVGRASEPVIREAIKKGIEMLGGRFVIGTDIGKALEKSDDMVPEGYLFSYDMLGEGSRTKEQAKEYLENYLNGTKKLIEHYKGKFSNNIYDNPNISIKLSALHPRYELTKKDRVFNELLPKLKEIIELCKDNNLWISIDAEESNRLELSLLVYQELLKDESLRYNGLGFVVQGYGRRALKTIQFLNNLAKENNIRIPIRLVKGAYWDSEIKYAQVNGLPSYPVFTRKSHTDLSYMVCAQEMIKNSKNIYPQFATHSAYTVAAILKLAQVNNFGDFEFQKLFGMGNGLYDQIIHKIKCRVYAPVGSYENLLPYLIRRILENGANNSFVSLVANKEKSLNDILISPIEKIERKNYTGKFVPEPSDLYKSQRENSEGYCFGNITHLEKLQSLVETDITENIIAKSLIAGEEFESEDIDYPAKAIEYADTEGKKWSSLNVLKRCELLERFADEIENNFGELFNILIYEAKKTPKDAIGEIRETVDLIRFYLSEAKKNFANEYNCRGYTGEKSRTGYREKGIFVCISPWNFPLAIFLGQISAALLAGNPVIAKPAEQTSKIAYYAIKLAHQIGIPTYALQLILGKGSKIGPVLTSSEKIAGVVFTGSTGTALGINRNLAARNSRIATFIAETGGQNCMIVDSTILLERTCDDIIESAFYSAGQRCSALRVCYIQEEVFEPLVDLLSKAMEELQIGGTNNFENDIGAVIDAKAKQSLEEHYSKMISTYPQKREHKTFEISRDTTSDTFFAPQTIEIPSINILEKENFGPILHIIKYKRANIDKVIAEINATGYGLTFGIQSRIQDFVNYVSSKIRGGNIYINRSTIGAVVETHPFGGSGLSGTGPKAGGFEYIKRFAEEYTITENTAAIGGNLELLS